MSLYTKEDEELVKGFRDALKGEKINLTEDQKTEQFLLPFLKARERTIKEAVELIKPYLEWRDKNPSEEILNFQPHEAVLKECQYAITGFDEDNSPIVTIPLGSWNVLKLTEEGHGKDFVRYCEQIVETVVLEMKDKTTRTGYPVRMFVCVVDVAKVSMKTLMSPSTLDILRQVGSTLEANYVHRLKKLYIINGNDIFDLVHVVVKPFMGNLTRRRVKVYRDDSWKREILENVPETQLPLSFGGTKKIDIIPGTNDNQGDVAKEGIEVELIVPPGQIASIEYEILSPGAKLHYILETLNDGHLYFWITANDLKVLATERLETKDKEPKERKFMCCYMGPNRIIFDNKHDTENAKIVKYKVVLLNNEPMDETPDPRWPVKKLPQNEIIQYDDY